MISIREIEASDKTAWAALWTDYLSFYESTLDADVFDTAFSRLLSTDEFEFSGFLACDGATPVGLVHYVFHRHIWKVENVCYLQDLYVDPAARNTKAAEMLINAVYDAADAAGSPSVYWMTQSFNTGGKRLYDRVGRRTPFIRYNR